MCLHVLPSEHIHCQDAHKHVLRSISNTHRSSHSLSVSHTVFFMLQCVYFFPQTLRNKESQNDLNLSPFIIGFDVLSVQHLENYKPLLNNMSACVYMKVVFIREWYIYVHKMRLYYLYIYIYQQKNVLMHACLVCGITPFLWPLPFYSLFSLYSAFFWCFWTALINMCQDLTENQTRSLHQIVLEFLDFYDSSGLTGLQGLKQNICPFNWLEFTLCLS